MNEKNTRKTIIDLRLQQAGWNVTDISQVVEEFQYFNELPEGVEEPQREYQGQRFCDYVLLGKDGKPLAVIEGYGQHDSPKAETRDRNFIRRSRTVGRRTA